jgi:hypothetical protein
MGMRAGRKKPASSNVGERPLRLGPWRRCAGDNYRMAEVGGIALHNALRAPRYRRPVAGAPAARAPLPRQPARGWVCAAGGRRMAHHFPECAVNPGTSARGHFTGTPTRSLRTRGAVAPGDNVRLPALGGIKPLAHRDARQPIAAPAACCPAPRPPAGGGGCAAGGRRQHSGTLASGHFVGTPARSLHARGAVVPSDHFRVRALGVITRFTPRRVRRRDRRRADGGAWRAEGAGILERRRAATSPGSRRAACTPVARWCRAITSGCVRWV